MFPGVLGGRRPGSSRAGKGLFGGLLAGAGLLLAATLVLFWNEGRAVKRAAVLEQGRAEVTAVESAPLVAANERRLVHVRGQLEAPGTLVDPDFGVATEGLSLRRRVEMYQWTEKKSRKDGSSGRDEYRYELAWSDRVIDHQRFNQPEDHENPANLPFAEGRWRAPEVRLGAFLLGTAAVDALTGWESVSPDPARLPDNLAASLRVEAGVLTSADSLDAPRPGDIRIRFDREPLGWASVVAMQAGGFLEPFPARRGELLLVERGSASAEAMINAAERANTGLGWTLRIGGFLSFWVGFGLMLRPISGVLGRIPVLGTIGRFVTTAVAGLLAATLGLLTIVSGWLFYRPWLLGILLVAVAAGVVWLSRRPRAAPAAPMPMTPPPPPPA